ncbi:MAG: hypothetical protein HKN09_01780 [Saprospiraceae bacterium]|nr:hypothetical protein [Saprospiraceae bacterium]
MIKVLLNMVFVLGAFGLSAQSFSAEVSSDSILLGNYIELRFKIENLEGEFEVPDLSDFMLLAGPNMSSSFQLLNGEMSSSKTYSYYIQPNDLGEYFIGPAYIVTGDKTYETKPVKISVYPNPQNIITPPDKQQEIFSFELPQAIQIPEEKKQKKSKKKLKRI